MTDSPTQPPDWARRIADAVRDVDDIGLARTLPAPPSTARASAVLMLFGSGAAGPDLVMIERAHGMRSHAGQVAFPGGAADPGDPGPAATALREAHEEIGLDPAGVELLVELPALWLPPSNFAVTTVLGWWREESPVAVVDPGEVAAVLRVPVSELTDPARRFTVRHPSGYRGPGFDLPCQLVLWGFTAALVDQVLRLAGLERPWDRTRTRSAPLEPTAGPSERR